MTGTTPESTTPQPDKMKVINGISFIDFLVQQGVYATNNGKSVRFDFLQHRNLPELWDAVETFVLERSERFNKVYEAAKLSNPSI